MMKKNIRSMSVLLLFALVLMSLLTARPASALTCSITPDNIPITMNYNGAKLLVSGQSTAGDDLIIKITKMNDAAHFKYIGKAGGIFWMKKGDISFTKVPNVYMLYSSNDIDRLLSPAEQNDNIIGYEALKNAAHVETENGELQDNISMWKNELVRFKEKQKLYAIHAGTVTRQHGQDSDLYTVEVSWPSQAAIGEYTVEALAVRDGKVVERAETSFKVERAGVVLQLSNLAFNRASLYGIMAVIIAIIAGFTVGMIFKKGGGAH